MNIVIHLNESARSLWVFSKDLFIYSFFNFSFIYSFLKFFKILLEYNK